MKIESIRLKNFKTFKEIEIADLPSFCVFVGANGTGKSTIFAFLDFCAMPCPVMLLRRWPNWEAAVAFGKFAVVEQMVQSKLS